MNFENAQVGSDVCQFLVIVGLLLPVPCAENQGHSNLFLDKSVNLFGLFQVQMKPEIESGLRHHCVSKFQVWSIYSGLNGDRDYCLFMETDRYCLFFIKRNFVQNASACLCTVGRTKDSDHFSCHQQTGS